MSSNPLKEPVDSTPIKAQSFAKAESISAAEFNALTQSNLTLKANNTRLTNTLKSIDLQVKASEFPEKLTLKYIFMNWRKVGEFIEQIIALIKALKLSA